MQAQLTQLISAEQRVADWQAGQLSAQDKAELQQEIAALARVGTECGLNDLAALSTLIEAAQADFAAEQTLESAPADWFSRALGLLLNMLDALACGQTVPPLDPALQTDRPKPPPPPKPPVAPPPIAPTVPPVPTVPPAAEDSFQRELLDTFLEEASDLAQEIDSALRHWRGEPAATQNADLIHRALHTLKGGARLAGLAELGDQSHDFESFVLEQQAHEPDESFFAQSLDRLDQLSNALDTIRQTGQESPPSTAEAAPQTPTDDTPATAANIRLRATAVEDMVNLSSEATVYSRRIEAGLAGLDTNLDELQTAIDRVQQAARQLDTETVTQIAFRKEQLAEAGASEEDFDPLEMDRYSTLQQLSLQLQESASDLADLRTTLLGSNRDIHMLLTQSGRIQNELNAQLLRTRMVPFGRLLPRLERIVRQTSQELGKQAEIRALDLGGELDRTALERLLPPLEHLLRNAIGHGIEDAAGRAAAGKPAVGQISLDLQRAGSTLILTIADDGTGLDFAKVRERALQRGLLTAESAESSSEEELAELLFVPGFSTATSVTQISGRGVGMDVVKSTLEEMGGSVRLTSTAGRGTQVQLTIPLTRSAGRALMVRIGEALYALPLASVDALVRLDRTALQYHYANPQKPLTYGGQPYRFGYLGEALGTQQRPPIETFSEPTVPLVLFQAGSERVALLVDTLIGSNDLVVKSLSRPFNTVPGLSGAAIMDDGSVVVTLDMPALLGSGATPDSAPAPIAPAATADEAPSSEQRPLIMVVDDSVSVRKVISRMLTNNDFRVATANNGVEALRSLNEQPPDLMLLDVEMPEMGGFELLGRLRSSTAFKALPVILITSRVGEKHRQHGLALGANNYFGKPYREDELLTEIRRLLDRKPHPTPEGTP